MPAYTLALITAATPAQATQSVFRPATPRPICCQCPYRLFTTRLLSEWLSGSYYSSSTLLFIVLDYTALRRFVKENRYQMSALLF